MDVDTVEFGRRLAAARLAANMTQQQLADQLGCGITWLRMCERGKRKPGDAFYAKVIERFPEIATPPGNCALTASIMSSSRRLLRVRKFSESAFIRVMISPIVSDSFAKGAR